MIEKKLFGKTTEGKEIHAYIMSNEKGESVSILDLGGAIQAINIKDGNGNLTDVALGYDTVKEYENNDGYLGALIGRYANRIAKGSFNLNGKTYKLYNNNGNNHLHGGKTGYDKRIWDAEITGNNLVLRLKSADMEEGYPGNCAIKVIYNFSQSSELSIEYFAVSDKDTIINLTNHCYYNLNGEGNGDILEHKLKLNASHFVEIDNESIPTGKISNVKGSAFDFTCFKEIGKDIDADYIQLKNGIGYDHNYVIDKGKDLACEVLGDKNNITMQVFTQMEGVQLYTGNFLSGVKGKGGKAYNKRYGFCLETQHFPDSINQPAFPSPILKAGKLYNFKTSYKFSI